MGGEIGETVLMIVFPTPEPEPPVIVKPPRFSPDPSPVVPVVIMELVADPDDPDTPPNDPEPPASKEAKLIPDVNGTDPAVVIIGVATLKPEPDPDPEVDPEVVVEVVVVVVLELDPEFNPPTPVDPVIKFPRVVDPDPVVKLPDPVVKLPDPVVKPPAPVPVKSSCPRFNPVPVRVFPVVVLTRVEVIGLRLVDRPAKLERS